MEVKFANSDIIPPLKPYLINTLIKDFNYTWYNIVGTKLVSTCFVNIFVPHILVVVKQVAFYLLRNKAAKKEILQKDMNNVLTGEHFNLLTYPNVIALIFMVLMFCQCCPIMLLFGGLAMFTAYWGNSLLNRSKVHHVATLQNPHLLRKPTFQPHYKLPPRSPHPPPGLWNLDVRLPLHFPHSKPYLFRPNTL